MKLAKKKRLERAKTKLKAKKLPKGHNITNTSFKAKKIVIPGQLKSNETEILTKKSSSLEVLFAHLNHHNISMRSEGLLVFKNMAIDHDQEIYNLNFPRVIDAVAKLITDPEREIRKSCIKVLEIILSKASSIQIEPHFKILVCYLMCGMTHINSNTRVDATSLLDVILKCCPKLMVDQAPNILPTFLNLISTSKPTSDSDRILSVISNKNMTDIQWRLRVLSALTNYFSAVVSFSNTGNCNSHVNKTAVIIKWDGKLPLFIGDHIKYNIDDTEKGYLPGILENQELGMDFRSNSVVENEKGLKSLIENLMPILFVSWIEVAPTFHEKNGKINLLPRETSLMLYCVLDIILKLCESLEDWEESLLSDEEDNMLQWFTKKFMKKILSTFWNGFPYVLHYNVLSQEKSKKKLDNTEDKLSFLNPVAFSPDCVYQNLALCYLLINFKEDDSEKAGLIVKFVQKCIKTSVTPEILPLLKKVLRVIFSTKSNYYPKSDIARSIIQKCQKSTEICNHGLFRFLCDFFLSPNCPINLRSKELSKWVASLPELLLQNEISFKVIETLRVLACQNHKVFMENLKKQRLKVVDSLCKIKISECSELEGRRAIIDILFRVADVEMFNYMCQKLKTTNGNGELLVYVENLKLSFLLICRKRTKLDHSKVSKHMIVPH